MVDAVLFAPAHANETAARYAHVHAASGGAQDAHRMDPSLRLGEDALVDTHGP
jgi:hypothetical protein